MKRILLVLLCGQLAQNACPASELKPEVVLGSAPIVFVPFSQSNHVLAESPGGLFSVLNAAGESALLFTGDQTTRQCLLSPDDTIAYCLGENALSEYRLSDGARLHTVTITNSTQAIRKMQMSKDGSLIAVLDSDYNFADDHITVVNTATFGIERTITETNLKDSMTIDPTNQFVYAVLETNELVKYDLSTGVKITVPFTPANLGVSRPVFNDAGELLVVSGTTSYYSIYRPFGGWFSSSTTSFALQDVASDDTILSRTLNGSGIPGYSATIPQDFGGLISPNGAYIGFGGFIKVETGEDLTTIPNGIYDTFSHNAARVALKHDDILSVYTLEPSPALAFEVPDLYLLRPALLDDAGDQFVEARKVRDRVTGAILRTLECTGDCDVTFHIRPIPHTNIAVSGGDALRIWDYATGDILQTLLPGAAQYAEPSPDGTMVVTGQDQYDPDCYFCGADSTTLKLYNMADLLSGNDSNPVVTLVNNPTQPLTGSMAFSPDSTRLYVYATTYKWLADDKLIAYSLPDGNMVASEIVTRQNVFEPPIYRPLVVDPSGKRLFLARSGRGNPTGQAGELASYDAHTLQRLHVLLDEPVTSISLSDNGHFLAATAQTGAPFGGNDGTLLFDAHAGNKIASSPIIGDVLTPRAFVENDSAILTYNEGAKLVTWSVDMPEVHVINVREDFLAAAAAPGADRNGDGIFDAADYVIAEE